MAGGEAAFDRVTVETLGGADTFATGTGVSGLAIDVDGGEDADTARYSGTAAADTIQVFANGTAVSTVVTGGCALDTTAVESLIVLGLGGEDTISATGNLAPLTALTIDGGDGGDNLRGGNGADVLIGGAATTSSTATRAATRRCWATATTASSGTRATAATPSTVRPASTCWTSSAPTSARRSWSSPTAGAPGSRATSATITMDFDNVEGARRPCPRRQPT